MMTVGNLFRRVLKAWAASLKRIRSTVILFSVPSSWAWSSLKFSVALRSGYFSTTTRSRDKAEDSPSWAAWNLAKASGVSWPVFTWTWPTLARASVTAVIGVLLEGGRAFDRLDEVGDEIGPPLVGVLDLAPLGLGLLIEADQGIVYPGDVDGSDEEHEDDDDEAADGKTTLIGHWGHSPFKRYSIIRGAAGAGFLI